MRGYGRLYLGNQSYQRSPGLCLKFMKMERWQFVQENQSPALSNCPGGGYGEWEGEEEKLLQYRLGETGLQLRAPRASSLLQVFGLGCCSKGPQPQQSPPPLLLRRRRRQRKPSLVQLHVAGVCLCSCQGRRFLSPPKFTCRSVWIPFSRRSTVRLSAPLRASALPGARAIGRSGLCVDVPQGGRVSVWMGSVSVE